MWCSGHSLGQLQIGKQLDNGFCQLGRTETVPLDQWHQFDMCVVWQILSVYYTPRVFKNICFVDLAFSAFHLYKPKYLGESNMQSCVAETFPFFCRFSWWMQGKITICLFSTPLKSHLKQSSEISTATLFCKLMAALLQMLEQMLLCTHVCTLVQIK